MAELSRIFIIHTTSNESNAQTDADFALLASTAGIDFVQLFPDLPHDEREQGRTDEYEFDVSGAAGMPGVEPIDSDNTRLMIIMTSTTNGWLPSSIWAIGETVAGEYVVLANEPDWEERPRPEEKWFDRGDGAVGPDRHLIS
jgi:hypothetical protein